MNRDVTLTEGPTPSSELIEMAEEASRLEAVLADIKATVYSPFSNDWMKIKFIKKAIEKAGY